MELPNELAGKLRGLEDALRECFGNYTRDDKGQYRVRCCGEMHYGSGCLGPDSAWCEKCGRRVVNVLSPHVSPVLINGSVTHVPTDEFIEAVGEKQWLVYIPEPQKIQGEVEEACDL